MVKGAGRFIVRVRPATNGWGSGQDQLLARGSCAQRQPAGRQRRAGALRRVSTLGRSTALQGSLAVAEDACGLEQQQATLEQQRTALVRAMRWVQLESLQTRQLRGSGERQVPQPEITGIAAQLCASPTASSAALDGSIHRHQPRRSANVTVERRRPSRSGSISTST